MAVGPDRLEFDVACRSVHPPVTRRRSVPRPSDGIRTESFVCDTCGRTVTVKVVARRLALQMRVRAALRLSTLLAFTLALVWTVGTRGPSVGTLLLAGLAVVFVLASVPQLKRLFRPGFRLALDTDLQGELEKTHAGTPVHVFSRPGGVSGT